MTDDSLAAAPVADWLDPAAMAIDPYESYARLRAEQPVAWVPALGMYLVSTTALCREVEGDPDTFSAAVGGPAATMTRALGEPPMLRKDGDAHAAERRTINPALRAKHLRRTWTPFFARNADRFIDALVAAGPDGADLNRDVAAPLASQNLVDMLGFRDVTPETMRRWSTTLIEGIANLGDDPTVWARCDTVGAEIDEHLDVLLPAMRREPDGSLIAMMATGGMGEGALRANTKLIVSGGMNEPQHALTSMVWALGRHPEQRRRVLADPDLWPAAFDETLRLLSPINLFPRQVTRDTELGGCAIASGSLLAVGVAAANRDETAFEAPAVFDVTAKRAHLAFGTGPHLCAGHWAARIGIGEVAVPRLYARLPGLRSDERRRERWFGWLFRGLAELPVTWDAEHP